MAAAGGNPRETCPLRRRVPEAGAAGTLSDPKTSPGRARVTHLLTWRLWSLPGGKGLKVLFLPRLCACCQETLTNTLTWAGCTGAYQQVANRNQSSAFRSLSRDWDNGVDGREGNRGKEKTVHGGEACVPSGHCVSQSTYHERGTLLSHLGHGRADVKRKGSCPSRRLPVTLTAGAELCVEGIG